MMLLYSLTLALVLLISAPWWLARMFLSGRYREGLTERLGRVPRRLLKGKQVLWLHAVSVGEVLAATRLIAELETALPEIRIMLSTTTQAGQHLARQRFGSDRVFYYPLDTAWAVRAYLKGLKPRMLLLMESELWPRMLVECERAGIPVLVANARVSDRSFPRYMRLRLLWRPLLQKVTLVLSQTEESAERWRQIGAPRVMTSGNLKYDVRSAGETELVVLIRQHLSSKAKVLVCGSTLEGEESALLDCWKQRSDGAVMVLAPRHPQRFDAVAALLEKESPRLWVRLSQWRQAPRPFLSGEVLLLDSIGELASLYSIASVAFVGGSLVDAGGHNPLEPAQFGVPVVMGPFYANFRSMIDAMRAAHAIAIATPETLCAQLQQADGAMGARGRAFFQSQAGATARTVDEIVSVLQNEAHG